jgi:putative transcriptional regulator
MAKLSPKELKKWEASRDLGAELERSVREMKAGKVVREHRSKIPEALEARFCFPCLLRTQ